MAQNKRDYPASSIPIRSDNPPSFAAFYAKISITPTANSDSERKKGSIALLSC